MLGQSSTASACKAQCVVTVTGFISNGVCTKRAVLPFYNSPTLSTISFLAVLKPLSTTLKGAVLAVNITPNEVMQSKQLMLVLLYLDMLFFCICLCCLLLYNLMTVNNAIPTTFFYVANRQSLRLKSLRIKTHLVQVKGLCM